MPQGEVHSGPIRMHQETITFQLATHYLPKIASHLERLFMAISQACEETHPIIHHYALKNVIEIIKLVEKPELKSRFIKELMRLEHIFNRLPMNTSNAQYARLFVQIQVLTHMAGKFGDTIHQDPFLQSMRLVHSEHNDACDLQAPQLILWLAQDGQKRQNDLKQWLKQLHILCDTVALYLSRLRDVAAFEPIDISQGFYHRPLSMQKTCQLILLRMQKNCGLIPQLHMGHHGLSIRLCDALTMQETRHTDALVELAICQM